MYQCNYTMLRGLRKQASISLVAINVFCTYPVYPVHPCLKKKHYPCTDIVYTIYSHSVNPAPFSLVVFLKIMYNFTILVTGGKYVTDLPEMWERE